ncbi:MAG: leucyl aminopeptidase [Desulfofustis sp.]|nr:leucyl aminopeptidase [Desulfofustis sp.]NNK55976.1 leucyl aminopeptidase [Desulfofustis sp.]
MTTCKVGFTQKSILSYPGAMSVFLVAEIGKKQPKSDSLIRTVVKELSALGDFKGKKDESLILYPGNLKTGKSFACRRVLLVGIGEINKAGTQDQLLEIFRKAGGTISQSAKKVKADELLLVLPEFVDDARKKFAASMVEGILLGNYRFRSYKKKDDRKNKYKGLKTITIHGKGGGLRRAVNRARIGAEAAISARDMANEPANHWTPEHFAKFGRDLARNSVLVCRVIGKNQIEKLGMGGIIAVNQGSAIEPRVVILEHRPKNYRTTVLLVGKGITFDSGGVSLKPAAGMEDMKYDMCGGAAVISTMQAVADNKPGVRVVAIVPTTDNMSGSSAVKPGDVITHYNGVTSEVINTDAEGRLILADALAYGIEKYSPDCVIDLATLTGAVIIGLGHHRSGLMSNNDVLADALSAAGEATGEKVWRLPLDQEYSEQLDSEVADVKNIGGRAAGSITAGAYLKKFVGDTPWAHLDIAGTAWEFTKKSYIPKGPSGIGVRLLLDFIARCSTLKFVERKKDK